MYNFTYACLAIFGLLTLLFLVHFIQNYEATSDISSSIVEQKYNTVSGSSCNVSGIKLRGFISTYNPDEEYVTEETYDSVTSEDIVALIEHAESEKQIKATLIEVDSYGGYTVAAEEISKAVEQAEKPVVAFVRSAALSAAYWGISAADHILASELSDIGSIGVTISYVETAGENEQAGRVYREISSGAFKDTGDPEKVLTQEEQELLMRDVKLSHDIFVRDVAENRELPIDLVYTMADGSSVLGAQAREFGLIDAIGGEREALAYLEETLGEPAEVCW